MGASMVVSAVEPVPGVPQAGTIRVQGSVTRDEAPALRRKLLDQLARTDASKMVLSLGDVDKMDTAGAAVLAEVVKRAVERDVRILLCSPSEPVLKIFRLAGFGEILARTCADPTETHRRLLA